MDAQSFVIGVICGGAFVFAVNQAQKWLYGEEKTESFDLSPSAEADLGSDLYLEIDPESQIIELQDSSEFYGNSEGQDSDLDREFEDESGSQVIELEDSSEFSAYHGAKVSDADLEFDDDPVIELEDSSEFGRRSSQATSEQGFLREPPKKSWLSWFWF